MDYREDYERGRRYREERGVRGADRRDWDRGDDRRDWGRHDYERRRGDDRGVLERLIDELRSWFGDEETRRRARGDRDEPGRWGGDARGWGAASDDDVDRDWARQWGYVERGDVRDRRERGAGAGARGYEEPRWGWGDPSAWGAEPTPSWERSRWTGTGGPHAGRGPRGYQRSDERIREDVCDVLCGHGFIDASEIEVAVLNGEVTLSGVVRERPQKRMAEDAAEQVSGVREVHNQLRVSPGGSGQDPQARPGDPRFRVA
jgi:hypothetical protein